MAGDDRLVGAADIDDVDEALERTARCAVVISELARVRRPAAEAVDEIAAGDRAGRWGRTRSPADERLTAVRSGSDEL